MILTPDQVAGKLTASMRRCLNAYDGDVISSSHDLDLPFSTVERLRYLRVLTALNAGKRGVRRIYQITPLGREVLAVLDEEPT